MWFYPEFLTFFVLRWLPTFDSSIWAHNERASLCIICVCGYFQSKKKAQAAADAEEQGPPLIRNLGKDNRIRDEKELKVSIMHH